MRCTKTLDLCTQSSGFELERGSAFQQHDEDLAITDDVELQHRPIPGAPGAVTTVLYPVMRNHLRSVSSILPAYVLKSKLAEKVVSGDVVTAMRLHDKACMRSFKLDSYQIGTLRCPVSRL
jgi:hypothetical protein